MGKKFLDKKQDLFFKTYFNAVVMDVIISYWYFDPVRSEEHTSELQSP